MRPWSLCLLITIFVTRISASGQTETQPPSQDKPAPPQRRAEFIRVNVAEVSHVAAMLKQLLADIEQGRQHPPGVLFDVNSHSVIVTGTPEDVERARDLVSHLDFPQVVPPAQEDRGRTSFQYVIYELSLPRDQAADLRVDHLTGKAETPASLTAALREIGDVQVLYRADQVLDLSGSSTKKAAFTTGSNLPFVRNTNVSDRGNVTSTVEYEEVGCVVKLEGGWDAPSRGFARIEMELSSMTDSTVDLGNDVKAPIFHKMVQHFDGPIASGKPIVLLTIDGSGDKENATAYVTRLQFDRTEAD